MDMTKLALSTTNVFINDVFVRIAFEAATIARRHGKSTVTHKDVQTAVVQVLPDSLAKQAVKRADQAINTYMVNTRKYKK